MSLEDDELPGFLLAHKNVDTLFVILTHSKKGKPQWEFTEDFDLANKFTSEAKADLAMNKHNIPRSLARIRPRQNCHSDWLQNKAP